MTARRAGRVARARGEAGEAAILAACERYRAQGVALVVKRATPIRALGSPGAGGRFPAVYQNKACCDLIGVVMVRRVLVEFKTAATPLLPLTRHGKPVLSPSQAAELDAAVQAGAWAGVLVGIAARPGPGVAWYLLRWSAWSWAVRTAGEEGAASLSHERLAEWGVAVDVPRWLDPIIADVGLTVLP